MEYTIILTKEFLIIKRDSFKVTYEKEFMEKSLEEIIKDFEYTINLSIIFF